MESSTFESISADFGIFGLPINEKDATVILLPVPWEATTSYGKGASFGPQIIRKASEQVDLFDVDTGKIYESGYFMRPIPTPLLKLSKQAKTNAQKVMRLRSTLSKNKKLINQLTSKVNSDCDKMTKWVYEQSLEILQNNKLLGLIGGDHSVPLGAIKAISEKYKGDFAILHIDAHADLRKSYQGFTQSHASIMYNVMHSEFKPSKLVQVGIRDFCDEEYQLIQKRRDIKTYFDHTIKSSLYENQSWKDFALTIAKELPEKIYISFDIDGLDPRYCPHTGTPVPGGLELSQVYYLFKVLFSSGKKLIGFDLNEVSTGGLPIKNSEWDGNVGARLLYKLCGWLALTNQKVRPPFW